MDEQNVELGAIDRQRSNKADDSLGPVATKDEGVIIDPVFGEIPEDGPNYRSVRPYARRCE